MNFLELILLLILTPFWFPVLLIFIGFFVLLIALLLVCLLVITFLILCLIIGILKTLYNVYVRLISIRQVIIQEIGNVHWLKLACLIFKKYILQIKKERQIKKQRIQEEIANDEA
jgi:membrane-bound ClpP family serine protease